MVLWIRKGRLHLVRSQNQSVPTSEIWSLFLKWLEALLGFTMVRPSIKLKSSLKWLGITLLSSQSPTSLSSMVDLVLVPPIHQGSFLSSDCYCMPYIFSLYYFLRILCRSNFCLLLQLHFNFSMLLNPLDGTSAYSVEVGAFDVWE